MVPLQMEMKATFPLVAPLKVDLVRTRYGRLDVIDWAEHNTISTIWSSLKRWVTNGFVSILPFATMFMSRLMRSFPPGQSVVTIL